MSFLHEFPTGCCCVLPSSAFYLEPQSCFQTILSAEDGIHLRGGTTGVLEYVCGGKVMMLMIVVLAAGGVSSQNSSGLQKPNTTDYRVRHAVN